MSDETKNKPAAEAAAEQAIAPEQRAEGATPSAEPAKPAKGKKSKETEALERLKAARAKQNEATGALKATGLAACKRHGLACVWVTEDGQCFDQESNALNHAKNLGGAAPLKVEA